MSNFDLPWVGVKRKVFLVIQALTWMGIWTMGQIALYNCIIFYFYHLICYFRHQCREKLRCDRKGLDHITLDERWVKTVNLVDRKTATFESSFLPLPTYGSDSPSPLYEHTPGKLVFVIYLRLLYVCNMALPGFPRPPFFQPPFLLSKNHPLANIFLVIYEFFALPILVSNLSLVISPTF